MSSEEQYADKILSLATDFWNECEQEIQTKKIYPQQTYIVKGYLKAAYDKEQKSR